MSYSLGSGSLILASDYNTIAWTNPSIGGHWGVGTGQHGLGQNTGAILNDPGSIVPIPATPTRITAVQWSNLFNTINKCLQHHQLTPVTIPSIPVAGNPITAVQAFMAKSQAAYNAAGTPPLSLSTSNPTLSTVGYTGTWGTGISNTLKHSGSFTFSSGDAARYFFNAGGKITLNLNRSFGSSTIINNNWSTLCGAVGTISFGYNSTTLSGNSGTPNYLISNGISNGGYWSGTTTETRHLRQFDASSGYYTSDYILVAYKWSGGSSNGGFQTLDFTIYYVNASGVAVDGTTTSTFVVASPTLAYLDTASWGTPAFTSSSVLTTPPSL
jgi:hypothetical protein